MALLDSYYQDTIVTHIRCVVRTLVVVVVKVSSVSRPSSRAQGFQDPCFSSIRPLRKPLHSTMDGRLGKSLDRSCSGARIQRMDLVRQFTRPLAPTNAMYRPTPEYHSNLLQLVPSASPPHGSISSSYELHDLLLVVTDHAGSWMSIYPQRPASRQLCSRRPPRRLRQANGKSRNNSRSSASPHSYSCLRSLSLV